MILLKSQVEGISSRKDNTLKITLGTQELSEGGKLFPLQNKLCSVGISPNDALTKEDIEILKDARIGLDDLPNGKTPSQRLRNTLYVYWQQNETGNDFNAFYQEYLEKLITRIKEKLD